ncbi:enoyl-CoA hydratase/isomerase family protein [Phytohabitans kaempferiae]|uniref:Enoyl-CoA hydratase/isomerase family protein n=1 Tax=Phytohabitans kaempferiae TaxID=1620943 RepID=A0ABV6MHL8_9ACTN
MTTVDRGGPPLTVERRSNRAWLRLNRPAKRNALNPALVGALGAAVRDAVDDERVRVIVIAGNGPSFCAGADLGYLHDCARLGRDPLTFLRTVSDIFTAIAHSPKPVVAAVHGHAVAGGLELALVCDVVVAQTGTLIGDGHVRNGLVPGGGSSLRLPRLVGEPLARWLLLTGELVPAEQLLPSGLVHAVIPHEGFDEGVDDVAARLAGVHAGAQRVVKTLLHQARRHDDALLDAELAAFASHWATTDMASNLNAFRHAGPAEVDAS